MMSRCHALRGVFLTSIALLTGVVLPLMVSEAAAQEITAVIPQRNEAVSFEKEILPILQRNCLACHSASEKQGALNLESPDAIRKGGDTGPAVVPGKGLESLLIRLASGREEPSMPPADNDVEANRLTSEELGLIQLWIDQGAGGSGSVNTMSPKRWGRVPRSIEPVQAIALSADGQQVAFSRGTQLLVYHVASGALLARLTDPALAGDAVQEGQADHFPAHRDLIQSLAMNSEGNLLVSGSFREIKVWRRPSDVQIRNIALGTAGQVMAVSPDGQQVAVAGADFVIRVWPTVPVSDPQSPLPPVQLSGHTAAVTSLRFTQDGQQLVSGSIDQTIRIWHVEKQSLQDLIETPGPVTALEIMLQKPSPPTDAATPQLPVSNMIVTGGGDNSLRIWDWPRAGFGPLTGSSMPRAVSAVRVSLSADQRWRAVIGDDGLVRVSEMPSAGSTQAGDLKEMLIKGPASVSSSADSQVNWKVTSAAVSGGETPLLLLGFADGQLELWDVLTQQLQIRWRGGVAPVPQVSIAKNGQSAATVIDETGRIHLWDLREAKRTLADQAANPGTSNPGENVRIRAIATSVNQEWIAWAGEDFRIRLKQSSQTEPGLTRVIDLPNVTVTALGVSDDGSQIFAGSDNGRLRILSAADGSLQKEMAIGEQSIRACGLLNGQVWIAEPDQKLRFRNREDGSVIREIGLPFPPTAVVFSADGQRLAIAGSGQTVRVLRADNGSEERALPTSQTAVRTMSFSANSEQLLITDESGQCGVWDVSATALRESMAVGLMTVWYSKDQQTLGLAVDGGVHRVAQRFRYRMDPAAGGVTALSFLNNDQTLIATTQQGAILGYVVSEGRNHFRVNHDGGISTVCVAADDQTLATGGMNGTIRFWLSNGNPTGVQEIRGLPAPVSGLCFSDNNARLSAAYGGERPGVVVHEVSTGTLQQRVSQVLSADQGEILGLIPAADGDVIVERRAASARYRPSLKKILAGHNQPVTALAVDPSRPDRLYSGSQDGVLRRWNPENGQSEQQYNHGSAITAIAIRPDGQRLATVSDAQNIRLWNVNGQQIQEMRGDVRRKADVIRVQQELNAARSRVNLAKQQLDTAEKEVPVRLEAEKKQNEAVAAAEKDLADKKQALDKATEEKTAAEKAAVEAVTLARQALREKELAELAVVEATAVVQQTQTRLNRLQQLLNAAPSNESIRQRVAAMQTDQTTAQEKLQQAMAAIQGPTQKSQDLSNVANQASAKVSELQKPWLDATEALKTAQANLVLAQTQQKLTTAERQLAEQLVPTKKETLAKAEDTVKATETQLEAANQRVQESNQPIRSCQFSPGGQILATAGDFGSLHSWDSETGVALNAYAGHTGPVRELRFLNDRRVISVADDQTARVWELNPDWNLERTIGSVDDPSVIIHRVTALDLSRDSSLILAGGGVPSRTGELQVFRVSDGARVFQQPEAHTDVIYSARFSPDGTKIASGGADRFVRVFKADNGELIRRLEGHTNYVLGVAWSGNAQVLVTASADQTIKVWDSESGDQQRTIENFGRPVTSVSFLGETDTIVSSCGDQLVRMHNSSNGGVLRNFGGADAWLHGVTATPDSGFVAAGDARGKVRIWNGNNGQIVRTLP